MTTCVCREWRHRATRTLSNNLTWFAEANISLLAEWLICSLFVALTNICIPLRCLNYFMSSRAKPLCGGDKNAQRWKRMLCNYSPRRSGVDNDNQLSIIAANGNDKVRSFMKASSSSGERLNERSQGWHTRHDIIAQFTHFTRFRQECKKKSFFLRRENLKKNRRSSRIRQHFVSRLDGKAVHKQQRVFSRRLQPAQFACFPPSPGRMSEESS